MSINQKVKIHRKIILVLFSISTFSSFSSGISIASVTNIDVLKLADNCDIIVIAKVIKLEDKPKDLPPTDESLAKANIIGAKIATAEIGDCWKGKPEKEIRFFASPTRYCDSTHVEIGEQVVLFLSKQPNSDVMTTMHAGRGVMHVHEKDNKKYLYIDMEVVLPKTIVSKIEPDQNEDTVKCSYLESFEKYIKQHFFNPRQ